MDVGFMIDSTIAAVATPPGAGGISIIRISGPRSASIAASIFRPAMKAGNVRHSPLGLESHRLYYGHICNDRDGQSLDEVLLAVMRAPRSYTREDVVEINCHGGPAAIRAVLDLVLRKGARLAEPGEFTRRAFLNGRIDLTQAEAVIDVINARTHQAVEVAMAQISGAFRKEVERVHAFFVEILTHNEAAIDFPEEEDVKEFPSCYSQVNALRQKAILPITQLLRNYHEGRAIREGLAVVIVGRPNVGKSSLMNRLLLNERAIVTPYPGTTRDAIEDDLVIQGVAVSLWDTAGLHESKDPVEVLGMQKTFERAAQADLILFVLEAHRPVVAEDFAIYRRLGPKPVGFVLNKIDLMDVCSHAIILPADWAEEFRVQVSALTGQGIEDLREAMLTYSRGAGYLQTPAAIIPNLRQKVLLEVCLQSAEAAAAGLENRDSPELVDIHLRQALGYLDEILGIKVKSEIIDSIFRRFCIGK
jgi:tRNA modification GTPase